MKPVRTEHLEAGVAVALVLMACLIGVGLVWSLFNLFAGPAIATAVIFLVLFVGIVATVIDWVTE